mmetsp:Transcript_17273/g.31284  ORF Transcript_17273/g.31284 Transcript_17273/m.31284 type:complete len:345 (-) Transcript_17273:1696-2730(-)
MGDPIADLQDALAAAVVKIQSTEVALQDLADTVTALEESHDNLATTVQDNKNEQGALQTSIAIGLNKILDLENSQTDLDPENRLAALETALAATEDRLTQFDTCFEVVGIQAQIKEGCELVINGDQTVNGGNLFVNNGESPYCTSGACTGTGNIILGYHPQGLIVGYNPLHPSHGHVSITGSHNIILGGGHTVSSYGSIVSGIDHTVNAPHASAIAGKEHTVSGYYAAAVGGEKNTVSREHAAVVGGYSNVAEGPHSSVTGGESNKARGYASSVSGGFDNTAFGKQSTVSGGEFNFAPGELSSISGGKTNEAIGKWSSILGGAGKTASEDYTYLPCLDSEEDCS